MPIRYTSLAAALVVTNQKCPSHQPFMSTLPAFVEILKTVHESVVKLWLVFKQVCQESEIPVKFGETDNASELWLIQYKKEHSFDTVR